MRWGSQLADSVKPVVDLIYPPRCPLCGDRLSEQGGLCASCWGELEIPGGPACAACATPLASRFSSGDALCANCLAQPPKHSGIVAATRYNDASRQLVLSFKHGRKIVLARLLGRLIAARMPGPDPDSPALIIPVPLHRWRLWQRGFNQAALLAQELAKLGHGELLVDGLVRTKRTPSLGGLGKPARKRALSGAITIRTNCASKIRKRAIILVDDVLTSGATTDACVRSLLNAGATSVRIACFARVIEGDGGSATSDNTVPNARTPEAETAPGAA